MQYTEAQELARARLAYVSAGRASLGAPRRALPQAELEQGLWTEPADVPEPEDVPQPAERPPEPGPPGPKPAASWLPKITVKHMVVVAVFLLCGVGVAVAALGRSAATELPLEPIAISSSAPEPTTPPPVVMVRLHVAGAVAEPGVVTLPEGSIVQDAILAAGGWAEGADPATLNLAAPVADGMQIVIGTVDEPLGEVVDAPPSASTGSSGTSGQVDLNRASAVELETLPGVGPVMAAAILQWREENGPFTAVEELQEISGIGLKTFQKLQPLVTV